MNISLITEESSLDGKQLLAAVRGSLEDKNRPKKALLIPPDITRLNSGAGILTSIYFHELEPECRVDILPALGTHTPMTAEDRHTLFGPDIPEDRYIVHNWRKDVVRLGEVPADYVRAISEGFLNEPIDVEVNQIITRGEYDLILSIGQVVPHEVVGMSNYSKNILVGCGGSAMINKSHFLGAVHGIERIIGRDHSPVRKVFDYAHKHFLTDLPVVYVLTVTTLRKDETLINGLFIGTGRDLFEQAVELSTRLNITFLESPLKRAVVWLDGSEFRSTWVGNKAIYRTRMAMEDDGELLILAPGIDGFGEDPENDRLIRKYGYTGRENVLDLCKTNEDLRNNLAASAHLIHGSTDGHFRVTYAVERLSREEIESVAFEYADYQKTAARYNPEQLREGYNTMSDGEEIYFIKNPAVGLWAERARFV